MTAGELLTLPELQDLREKSAHRGAGLVLHAGPVIAATVLLYALVALGEQQRVGVGPRMEVAPGYLDVLRRVTLVDAG